MRNFLKSASVAAIFCATLVAVGGSGAFGASDIVDSNESALLPAAVIEAARIESEAPANYNIIPETPSEPDEAETIDRRPASSLAALVTRYEGTTTRNREEECLAGAVYFEAKGESLDGQLAVARVIMNRAQSGRFPGSLCGVVFQPGQFSFVRGGGFPPIARGGRDWKEAVAIAKIARDSLWQSPVPKALFFHARHVSPRWKLTRIAAVGNHIFYR